MTVISGVEGEGAIKRVAKARNHSRKKCAGAKRGIEKSQVCALLFSKAAIVVKRPLLTQRLVKAESVTWLLKNRRKVRGLSQTSLWFEYSWADSVDNSVVWRSFSMYPERDENEAECLHSCCRDLTYFSLFSYTSTALLMKSINLSGWWTLFLLLFNGNALSLSAETGYRQSDLQRFRLLQLLLHHVVSSSTTLNRLLLISSVPYQTVLSSHKSTSFSLCKWPSIPPL